MGAIERMTITMPAELAEAVRQTVAGGEYALPLFHIAECGEMLLVRRQGEYG